MSVVLKHLVPLLGKLSAVYKVDKTDILGYRRRHTLNSKSGIQWISLYIQHICYTTYMLIKLTSNGCDPTKVH